MAVPSRRGRPAGALGAVRGGAEGAGRTTARAGGRNAQQRFPCGPRRGRLVGCQGDGDVPRRQRGDRRPPRTARRKAEGSGRGGSTAARRVRGEHGAARREGQPAAGRRRRGEPRQHRAERHAATGAHLDPGSAEGRMGTSEVLEVKAGAEGPAELPRAHQPADDVDPAHGGSAGRSPEGSGGPQAKHR